MKTFRWKIQSDNNPKLTAFRNEKFLLINPSQEKKVLSFSKPPKQSFEQSKPKPYFRTFMVDCQILYAV